MEPFRTIASGFCSRHSPSRTLLTARAMCAAALYGVDCGGALRPDFSITTAAPKTRALAERPTTTAPLVIPDSSASRRLTATDRSSRTLASPDCGVALRPDFSVNIAAPKPRALAEAPTTTAPLVNPESSASRRLATTDGSRTLASPLATSWYAIADRAPQAGTGGKPLSLLLTAGTSVPASSSSSSTALGVSPSWGRRSPSYSGGCIFSTNKMLRGASSPWAWHQLSVSASYSTSSGGAHRKAAAGRLEREAPLVYVAGMFDDINEPKWTPLEFAETHVPLKKVKLIGDEVDKEYTVLTELAKGWFVSLPLLIEKLKEHGYSFYNPVTISQLMVDKYGQFVMPSGTLLQKTNVRHASNDYISSASVYEEIIRHSCRGVVPPDSFKDFLITLRKKKTPNGYYMCVHAAFLPLSSYSQAYLDIYDHVKENLTGHQSWDILSSLKITARRWKTIMEDNELLVAWFEDPYNEQRNQDEERYNFGNPRHLFIYLRHVHSHLLVYVKLFGKYTKDEARILVDCKFSKVMSNLCWRLWHHSFLVDIESEASFCKEGSACCPTPGFCLRRKIRLILKESRDRNRTADAELR